MKQTVGEGDNYPLPEDTLLSAKVGLVIERKTEYLLKEHHKKVKDGKAKVGDKDVFHAWEWPFFITEPGFEGLEVMGTTDPRITSAEGDKPKGWYETILDTTIQLGDDVDTDMLQGLPCIITIKHREPRSYNGRTYYECEIDDVFPVNAREVAGGVASEDPPF
jgi:hypothetical protein